MSYTVTYIDSTDTSRTIALDFVSLGSVNNNYYTNSLAPNLGHQLSTSRNVHCVSYKNYIIERLYDKQRNMAEYSSLLCYNLVNIHPIQSYNQNNSLVNDTNILIEVPTLCIVGRTYPRFIYGANERFMPTPKSIDEILKIIRVIELEPASLERYDIDIFKVTADEAIQYILEYKTSFHLDPVYSDATKINYTDGSYEVIRDKVLTEEQVKIHAYKNLLNSYGSFYRATEKEINTLDKR